MMKEHCKVYRDRLIIGHLKSEVGKVDTVNALSEGGDFVESNVTRH